ncbi:MAG: 16S rRNA (cytosine(1402)-N(4))-methyltransferase RsmH [Aphanocapsa lilacina HA4352-LM1]|nr:16S rRNA (cytosine(1402)-N(4))-methyltransferase RsmH [Aphanocapsa lilacina HA4352-LM1]
MRQDLTGTPRFFRLTQGYPGRAHSAVNTLHRSVLLKETLAGLQVHPGGLYLDATVGLGGHSEAILRTENTQVVALDQDEDALAQARLRLAPFGERVRFEHINFAEFEPGEERFDGIVADLGVSSMQLDSPERGFSWRFESPLDMRMDGGGEAETAADLVNTCSAEQLSDLFWRYGEERFSRRIARRIVERRPLRTTTELAAVVASAIPTRQPIHPATRVFQALRIAVNGEVAALETFLERSPDWLVPGGRLAVISFHSLEDRPVKHRWRADPRLEVLTRKTITADEAEIQSNPRARSARLRLARRLSPSEESRP